MSARHPNKAPFIGVLAPLDRPSDRAPSGARGHRVVLTSVAAEAGLPSLIGMGINVPADGQNHQAHSKVGVIESAEIVRNEIVVAGYIWSRDCPTAISTICACAENGMSYEVADAHVEDMRAEIWRLTRVTFTGASVLPRSRAAYKLADFVLVD